MATPAKKKPATRRTAPAARSAPAKAARPTRAAQPNLIDLLEKDHKKVKKLFKDFEKLAKKGDDAGKIEIARQICQELTVHAQVEEEIFYPAAHEALADLIDEATVEHATAKDLIAQIEAMNGSEQLYDAKVKVLGEYIDHHVEEEEGEIFPKARKAKLDLEALGAETKARKEELLAAAASPVKGKRTNGINRIFSSLSR
jgi:hemerythrin superfamily protein